MTTGQNRSGIERSLLKPTKSVILSIVAGSDKTHDEKQGIKLLEKNYLFEKI